MAKAIMPSLECVNILKNYFVSNMWYEFDVCVVQSRWEWGNFFKCLFAISVIFCNEKELLIVVRMGFNMNPFLQMSL
jgi:hypothetical protein